jgi:large repetitive protein
MRVLLGRWSRALWVGAFLVSLTSLTLAQGSRQTSEFDAIEERDRDNPKARDQWFMRGRTAPNGESAAALRFRAYQQKLQLRRVQFAARAVTAVPHGVLAFGWSPLGPAPLASDAGTGQDYGWVSGRATAVAIDPADATGNTVYVGGAHGGVWRSNNAGPLSVNPASVVWTPVLDYESTLAVGAIAIQPSGNTDTTRSVVLVGTGEPNSSADSYYGLGILRSADGGATWTQIPSDVTGTHSFAGLGFSKIAFSTSNPQLVVAATAAAAEGYALGLESPLTVNRGIYYSQDAGVTWRYATIKDGTNTVSAGSVTSVVYNASAAKFFAAVRYHGIYSSSDGITWTRLADANQPGSGLTTASCPATSSTNPVCPIYRAELAVVPGRMEMYTWVMSIDSTGTEVDGGIWQNMNGGSGPWNSIPDGNITNCGDPGLGGCGVQQGAYNLEIGALPNGSGTDLYAGAINLYKCRMTSPSSPGSNCFVNLTHVYGCLSIANVHPDQHHLAGIIAGGKELMYFANDGGIYRALDGYTGLTTGTCAPGTRNQFDNLNGSLGSMTQFVSFSVHPTDANTLLGGTQDNGSPATSAATTSSVWSSVQGGDGGYNAISPTNATDWFAAFPDLPPGGLRVNYCGSGISCTSTLFQEVVNSAHLGNDDGAFYFPYMLDPQASSQMIVGTCRVWRGGPATSSGGVYTALSNNFETGATGACSGEETNQVHSLAAGGPKDGNGYSKVIYAGTDGLGFATNPAGGRVFVTTNAGTTVMADRTGSINPGQFPVSSIAIDPSDATGQTAFAAIMGFHVGHVFKTTNAGLSWTDFSGSSPNQIPDAPADALLVDGPGGFVYVGTDVGVFSSSTANANWTEVGPAASLANSGYLPNVPVTALRLFNSGGKKLLRASTYGRGIWQFDLQASTTPDYAITISNPTLTVFPTQTATFNGTLVGGNGYASAVALSCTARTTAPPSTCTPSPGSVTPTGAGAPFTVSAGGIAQDYLFNVRGVGSDASTTTHDAAVTLRVVDFSLGAPSPSSVTSQQGSTSGGITFSVTGAGAFTGTVTLSCPSSGMPTGVTCTFTPTTVSALPATVTLVFTAASSTPLGTTPIVISAVTPGAPAAKTQSVSLTVTVPAPDYSLTVSNSPQSATADQTPAIFNGVLKSVNGYNSAVNLTCGASVPPTCTIAPATVTPTVSGAGFTVTVKSGVAQTYNFNVNGAGTDAAHVAHVAPVTFNSLFTLTLSASNGTQSVVAGQTATYNLTVTPVGATSFPSVVNFSCSGLPLGTTCSNPSITAGANGVQTVALAISTSGPGRAQIRPSANVRGPSAPWFAWMFSVGMVIGGLVRVPAARRRTMNLMGLTLVAASAFILPSCGGSGSAGGGGGAGIVVSVSPRTASKYPTQQQQFTVSVSGSSNTQVAWQVNGTTGGNPAAGTIDNNGMYTAPNAVPNPAAVSVTAVSQADVTKSGAATMTILSPTPAGTYAVTITATVGSVTLSTPAVLVVE